MLSLRAVARRATIQSDDSDEFVGRREGGIDLAEVSRQAIRTEILPALLVALNDRYHGTRAAACIAIGKVASGEDTIAIDALRRSLSDQRPEVQESALIAFGLLGSRASVPFLQAIAAGDRELVPGLFRSVEANPRLRAAAALALGLIGQRHPREFPDDALQGLLADVRAADTPGPLAAASAIALGLASGEGLRLELRQLARDQRVRPTIRALIATAIGRTGDRGAIQDLVHALDDRDGLVARSSALALGQLVQESDIDALVALERCARSAGDRGLRAQALLALGETALPRAVVALQVVLGEADSEDERIHAALALGLAGLKNESSRAGSAAVVAPAYAAARSEVQRAAFGLALGMLKSQDAAPALRERLAGRGGPIERRYAAYALGLLSDEDARPILARALEERGDPSLRAAAAKALGRLRDPSAVSRVTAIFPEALNDHPLLQAMALALGGIGDRSAVTSLSEFVLRPHQHGDLQRAFATIALGLLGDKDSRSLLGALKQHTDPAALEGPVAEFLSIL